jgi:hypothetical protein
VGQRFDLERQRAGGVVIFYGVVPTADGHAVYRSFGHSRLAGCQTVGSSLVGQGSLVFDETVEPCCHALKNGRD